MTAKKLEMEETVAELSADAPLEHLEQLDAEEAEFRAIRRDRLRRRRHLRRPSCANRVPNSDRRGLRTSLVLGTNGGGLNEGSSPARLAAN
jgi:hypothetical protein